MSHVLIQLPGFGRDLLLIGGGVMVGCSIGQHYEIRRRQAEPTIRLTRMSADWLARTQGKIADAIKGNS
jgi:hypothetical protein